MRNSTTANRVATHAFVFTFEIDFLKFGNQIRVQGMELTERVDAINPQAAAKIQPELMSGESIHRADMPSAGIIFHSDDWTMIPFSLIWTSLCVFWEGNALGLSGQNIAKRWTGYVHGFVGNTVLDGGQLHGLGPIVC
jgi:hypothetical protein